MAVKFSPRRRKVVAIIRARPATPRRRRRADAERSAAAILEAAIDALRDRPDASVEEIAARAGLTRQTVYAHYVSREALMVAVMERVSKEVARAIDAIALNQGPAAEVIVRLLDVSWQAFERYPFLPSVAAAVTPAEDRKRHALIVDRLKRVIRRGQSTGEFETAFPTTWLVAAIVALGHAAGQEVGAGRLDGRTATHALRHAVLRLLAAPTA